jgi:hypothetical protein
MKKYANPRMRITYVDGAIRGSRNLTSPTSPPVC